jgi:DNA-binding CsgD family transcriptional regulator
MKTNPTARQLVALNHLSQGRNIDQTADAMCLSRSSVEKLLADARRRINARTLTHAVSLAIRGGLICAIFVVSVGSDLDVQRVMARRSSRRDQFQIVRVV